MIGPETALRSFHVHLERTASHILLASSNSRAEREREIALSKMRTMGLERLDNTPRLTTCDTMCEDLHRTYHGPRPRRQFSQKRLKDESWSKKLLRAKRPNVEGSEVDSTSMGRPNVKQRSSLFLHVLDIFALNQEHLKGQNDIYGVSSSSASVLSNCKTYGKRIKNAKSALSAAAISSMRGVRRGRSRRICAHMRPGCHPTVAHEILRPLHQRGHYCRLAWPTFRLCNYNTLLL